MVRDMSSIYVGVGLSLAQCVRSGQLDVGSLLHGEYHSARIGVRQPPRMQWAA